MGIAPALVHPTLKKAMLADGLSLVFDLERSRGWLLHDALSGRDFVDFFGFFGSLPLGFNHPSLSDPEWLSHIGRWAMHKPSNSDMYSVPFAEFVATFQAEFVPPEMKHTFFICGGALAVENALKAAFDWKTRRNQARGIAKPGERVVHLKDAFHGRSGYTMSLTNTDPAKTDLFPKFDWPRILNPYCAFPLSGKNLEETREREAASLAAARRFLAEDADTIAAIILEPIQAEGGDHHFRGEYLAGLRALADEFDVLLIFDEVQTGFGTSGKKWCYQHFAVQPDLLAFGKKAQICGIMANSRIDEVPENVFKVPSRINSTWGGNLTDMIRSTRIMEVIRRDNLVENAARRGEQLVAGLRNIQEESGGKFANARGRGLLAAIDLPSTELRNKTIKVAYEAGLLCLKCGPRTVRFRPALDVDAAGVDAGIEILRGVARKV
ncbi:MAG: L-lysine 6-transaminase [Planctomycetes bacterium]|nr:L-lysine 6-transaminase [Planctomycetota bacterium]